MPFFWSGSSSYPDVVESTEHRRIEEDVTIHVCHCIVVLACPRQVVVQYTIANSWGFEKKSPGRSQYDLGNYV